MKHRTQIHALTLVHSAWIPCNCIAFIPLWFSIQFQCIYDFLFVCTMYNRLQLQRSHSSSRTVSVSNSNFMPCGLMAILCERNKRREKWIYTTYRLGSRFEMSIISIDVCARTGESEGEMENRRNHFKYMLNTSFPRNNCIGFKLHTKC